MKNLKEQIKRKRDMTKTLILASFAILAFAFTTNAQNGDGFGIKAGLNYNSNGDYFESINASAQHPSKNAGFHVGLYGKLGHRFYFKPELVYTQTKSEYGSDALKLQKIDAPLLFGIKVIGPVSVFAGPSLQYIIGSKFNDIKITDLKNDFTIGANFGVALNFNGFGIDVRYERGLNSNEATFIDSAVSVPPSRIDTRPEQLILGISFAL